MTIMNNCYYTYKVNTVGDSENQIYSLFLWGFFVNDIVSFYKNKYTKDRKII